MGEFRATVFWFRFGFGARTWGKMEGVGGGKKGQKRFLTLPSHSTRGSRINHAGRRRGVLPVRRTRARCFVSREEVVKSRAKGRGGGRGGGGGKGASGAKGRQLICPRRAGVRDIPPCLVPRTFLAEPKRTEIRFCYTFFHALADFIIFFFF